MKNSLRVAFCGIVTALVSALMTASFIPNITFAVPAIAGVLLILVFAQVGTAAAFLSFAASAIISFFISDKTSWLLFVALFGYYPILKPVIEKIKKQILRWLIKLLVFNISAVMCYLIEVLVFRIEITNMILALAFVSGNIVFVLYDIAVSRIAALYYLRLNNKISSILKQ